MSALNSNELNSALFDSVVLTALEAVAQSKLCPETQRRWANAINAASTEIKQNPYFTFDAGVLVILSDTSTTLYEVQANGSHEGCRAHDLGFPCRHRALRRLLDLYNEAAKLPHLPRTDLEPKAQSKAQPPAQPKATPVPAGALVSPSLLGMQSAERYGGMMI